MVVEAQPQSPQLPRNSPNRSLLLSYSKVFRKTLARMWTSILKIAGPQPLRDARIAPVSMSAALKNPSDFISLSDEVWGIFVFSEEVVFSNSANLGTHFCRKHWGIQRGISPCLRVSNRGEQHPVGTRLCSQSLVCYTFSDR